MRPRIANAATPPPTAPPIAAPLTLDPPEEGAGVPEAEVGVRLGLVPLMMVFTAVTLAFWTCSPAAGIHFHLLALQLPFDAEELLGR